MKLSLDRATGWITGGGVYARVDLGDHELKQWCKAALTAGYDLDGMVLEMWDRGWTGPKPRPEPMLCLTCPNAAALLSPSVDRERAQKKRARVPA